MKVELNITGIPLRRGYGGTSGTLMACHPKPWRRMVRFEEPSNYGIRQGRISKLWLTDADRKETVNYDRGWDMRPVSAEAKAVLAAITKNSTERKRKWIRGSTKNSATAVTNPSRTAI